MLPTFHLSGNNMLLIALRYWKEAAIASLIVVIFFVYLHTVKLNSDIDKLTVDLEVSQKHLEVSQNSLKELKITVDRQNASIASLEEEAKQQLSKHQEQLTKSATVASKYKKQAQDLLNRKPQPNMNLCDNANKLINEEIKNVSK